MLADDYQAFKVELASLGFALVASESATARARVEVDRLGAEVEAVQTNLGLSRRVIATAARRVGIWLRSYGAGRAYCQGELDDWNDDAEVMDFGFDILDGVLAARPRGRKPR